MFPLRDNIPTEHFPVVTVLIIVANCIVYFFLQDGFLGLPDGGAGGNWSVADYALIPYEVTNPGDMCEAVANGSTIVCEGQPGVTGVAEPQPSTWVTVFTSMFMHGSLLHIGGNMLFLWIFGNNVEDAMGPIRFVAFYLLGGLAADAAQILVDTDSTVPTLGASGAVAAVLGGYLLLFPRARVVTFVFIIFFFTILELPAILFLGIWILQQALFAYFDLVQPTGDGGGVAYFAHIGGFVLGLLAVRLFAEEHRRRRQLERAR
ncbi:MAG TPA: rhomboid family intramembrane serine protease [Solirubrobacteraceae bacterium]|nr:rhomboid family intramembrane serine protease [Solirubrobacteraceae bacterium]